MRSPRGQTLVEMALVMPLFIMVLFGIVVLGIGVFYQQQLANAAREGARFASVHSATADCPTTSSKVPDYSKVPAGFSVDFCDSYTQSWPKMTPHTKAHIAGIPPANVHLSACWSGYVDSSTGQYDAPPPGEYPDPITGLPTPVVSTWAPCLIDGSDPSSALGSIGCEAGLARTDTASNLSDSDVANVANRVTVYVCYRWRPPMAGFLLIPNEVVLRAESTEPIERQQ